LDNNIEVVVHPAYVPVAYHPVYKLVPELYADFQPDLALHIGVASGRSYFAIENTATRGFFQNIPDVDNKVFSVEEQEQAWSDQPTTAKTDINLESVIGEWQERTAGTNWPPGVGSLMDAKGMVSMENRTVELKLFEKVFEPAEEEVTVQDGVKWTDAVGNYLCGFIYYTGMAEMSKNGKNKRRDVAFMHVPDLETEEALGVGVDVTVKLIQSLVKTWREQRGA
jgi:pyrrolidone-carboxylate peptidase